MESRMLIKLILVSFLLGGTFGRSSKKSQKVEKRIIHGTRASISDWPFIASLSYGTNANVLWKICTASLLSRRWLVTAAHCVMNRNDRKLEPEHVKVNIRSKEGSWRTELYDVDEILTHPDWVSESETRYDYDIAMIKLDREVPSHMQTIPVYSGSGHLSNCKVAGWGATRQLSNGVPDILSGNYEISDTLRQINVPIGISREACAVAMHGSYPGALCAGDKTDDPADAQSGCIGDSGSPLVCQSTSGKVLYGLLLDGDEHCTPGADYMHFKDVSKSRAWVYSVI